MNEEFDVDNFSKIIRYSELQDKMLGDACDNAEKFKELMEKFDQQNANDFWASITPSTEKRTTVSIVASGLLQPQPVHEI